MKHFVPMVLAIVLTLAFPQSVSAQFIAGQLCASVTAVGEVPEGAVASVIVQPSITPGEFGQTMDCVLARRADGVIELVAVENVPIRSGHVQVMYRETQILARALFTGSEVESLIAACFADTPVAGEFECETYFHDAVLFERTFSNAGNLVGLNLRFAPLVLYDGDVFAMEIRRAASEDLRVQLRFLQSDLTLRLTAHIEDEFLFGLTSVEDVLSLNAALNEPGANLIIDVSANGGSVYEHYEITRNDLELRIRYLGALASLMLTGT